MGSGGSAIDRNTRLLPASDLADAHTVTVLRRFFRVEVSVGSARDDRYAPFPEPLRHFIGPKRADGPGSDGDEVDRCAEIDVRELFVDKGDVPSRGREAREIGEGETDKRSSPYLEGRKVLSGPVMGGLYDEYARSHSYIV